MKRFPIIAVVLVVGLLAPPVATARGGVPSGFVGTDANGPLVLLSPAKIAHEFDVMATSGVESVRTDFFWDTAQPYQSFDKVPPSQRSRYESVDGVPTDFSAMDRLVRLAAARRISLLPVVSIAPAWAAQEPGNPNSPPSDDAAYARFVAALVSRYGSHGSFWSAGGPVVPIRSWEIWNEPNSWLSHYALLLRAVRPALKQADPGAQMVAGALTNTSYSLSWNALQSIYAAGGRGQFDAVAINPYTFDINGVVENARLIRRVMSDNGDSRLPLLITEMSWPSALHRTSSQPDWVVTPTGEAQRVREAYRELASLRTRLKLQAAYWYTWLTADNQGVDAFGYAGLRRLDMHGNVVAKPAYFAFKQVALALEGCRSKGPAATSCRH